MKYLLFLTALATIFLYDSCLKSQEPTYQTCTGPNAQQQEPLINTYLKDNNLTNFVKDSTGLFYEVDSVGTGPQLTLNSKVFVTYTGQFTDNSIFEQVTDASKTGWYLGTMLKGWQIGLPKIAKGGGMRIIIPAELAYGCAGQGKIPANAILIFTIHLVDVQ